MFKDFFKNRKFRAIAFSEQNFGWTDGTFTTFSIVFFENNNGNRKWTVTGSNAEQNGFRKSPQYASCETWRHTGLLPEWAKDPLAEKLMR